MSIKSEADAIYRLHGLRAWAAMWALGIPVVITAGVMTMIIHPWLNRKAWALLALLHLGALPFLGDDLSWLYVSIPAALLAVFVGVMVMAE